MRAKNFIKMRKNSKIFLAGKKNFFGKKKFREPSSRKNHASATTLSFYDEFQEGRITSADSVERSSA